MFNDGFQPWYSDRKKFGMRPMSSRESNATEEGLATINTVLQGKTKYLWSAALLSCKCVKFLIYTHKNKLVDNYFN